MPFDHFDVIAPLYERVIPPAIVSRLVELAGLPIAGRLLDAGGGTGRVAQALRGQAGQVIVADASAGMVRQAAAKDGLRAARAHAEWLPFASASFERILMIDALHHVAEQRQTAAEMWRVLTPGGRIVIGEPDIRRWPVKLIALAEKAALMRSHILAPARIIELFAGAEARTTLVEDGLQAWVIIEKPAGAPPHLPG
jgi:demethylmenaquinone methyltransferase/2-methoxy-6-polyprenyl-1,4-benzoquinol methylase